MIPDIFDECFYNKKWTKAVVEPYDYKEVEHLRESRDGKYQIFLARVNPTDMWNIYRTEINKDLEDTK